MSVLGKRVIYAGPAESGECQPLTVEGIALDAMLPGTVVSIAATGLQTSAVAATVFGQLLLVADKDELRTRAIDEARVVGDSMQAIQGRSGEYLNVLVAAGNNITTRGTALSRNGAGKLKIALTDGTEEIVAYSDEVVNVTADALVRVKVKQEWLNDFN